MNIDTMRRAMCLVALVLPMTWVAGSIAAQMQLAAARGESYGVAVNTPSLNQKSPYAVLPTDGATTIDRGQSVALGDYVTAQDAFAIVSGDADPSYGSNAVSSATLGTVSLLNGLISADGVVAVATSTLDATGAASDAEGSSLANLFVNGTAISDPAPNTRMDLPGVGYVLLNERNVTGDGVTSSGITVNMIHVVLQQPVIGLLGQVIGYQTVGNIIVGSATSGVN
ncbi:MAG TPA: choice-of-anchor P family protein [Gemmatimonadales bacterium]|jgi:hypothetical protein